MISIADSDMTPSLSLVQFTDLPQSHSHNMLTDIRQGQLAIDQTPTCLRLTHYV